MVTWACHWRSRQFSMSCDRAYLVNTAAHHLSARRWIAITLSVTGIFASVLAHSARCEHSVDQKTSESCSPAISDVGGNVTITCFDPNVAAVFLNYINNQQKSYEQKAQDVKDWISRYNTLLAKVGAAHAFENLRDDVKAALERGDFISAGKAQDQIIDDEEKVVDQLAQDLFVRAEMLVLQLHPNDALPTLCQSISI